MAPGLVLLAKLRDARLPGRAHELALDLGLRLGLDGGPLLARDEPLSEPSERSPAADRRDELLELHPTNLAIADPSRLASLIMLVVS